MNGDQLSFDDDNGDDDEPEIHDIPHARNTDPPTSHAAGRQTEAEEGTTTLFKPNTDKHLALRTLANQPDTAIEVERRTGKRGIWKRVSDLHNAELIYDIGTRRDPHTNREGLVWRVNDRGWLVLAFLDRGEVVRI